MENEPLKTNTQLLLDRARKLCSPSTQYELAKRLDIEQTTISRVMRRRGTLDNASVLKLARFIDQPFEEVLALVELDRAKTDRARDFWERHAPRVLPPLVVAGWLAGWLGMAGGSAQAGTPPADPTSHKVYTRQMRRGVPLAA